MSLISHLWDQAFEFYYQNFSKNGELNKEALPYEDVKGILRKEFGAKRDCQRVIEEALSLKLCTEQSVPQFAIEAAKVYSKADFTMKQNFVFFSKAVLVNEQIQNFIILRALSTFSELQSVLEAYDEFCTRFLQLSIKTCFIVNGNQDNRSRSLVALAKKKKERADMISLTNP